jgi:hypothetical protein
LNPAAGALPAAAACPQPASSAMPGGLLHAIFSNRRMTSTPNRPPAHRLLLTGAAGALGTVLRQRLKPHARILRVSDIESMGDAQDGEEVVPCDLADKLAVDRLVAGCDAIVHMGGISVERPFEDILEANIRGAFHLYEGSAPPRRAARGLRQLEPRRRLPRARRGPRRGRMPAPARRLLRLVQVLRRGPVALLLRPLRHRDRLPAHRLVLRAAQGPPHAGPPG